MARVIVEESDRGLHRRRVVALGGTGCADPERTIPVVASVALLAELVGDVGAHATRVSRTESLDEIGEPAVGDPRVGLDGRAVREVGSVVADRDALEIRIVGGGVGEEGDLVLEALVIGDPEVFRGRGVVGPRSAVGSNEGSGRGRARVVPLGPGAGLEPDVRVEDIVGPPVNRPSPRCPGGDDVRSPVAVAVEVGHHDPGRPGGSCQSPLRPRHGVAAVVLIPRDAGGRVRAVGHDIQFAVQIEVGEGEARYACRRGVHSERSPGPWSGDGCG